MEEDESLATAAAWTLKGPGYDEDGRDIGAHISTSQKKGVSRLGRRKKEPEHTCTAHDFACVLVETMALTNQWMVGSEVREESRNAGVGIFM